MNKIAQATENTELFSKEAHEALWLLCRYIPRFLERLPEDKLADHRSTVDDLYSDTERALKALRKNGPLSIEDKEKVAFGLLRITSFFEALFVWNIELGEHRANSEKMKSARKNKTDELEMKQIITLVLNFQKTSRYKNPGVPALATAIFTDLLCREIEAQAESGNEKFALRRKGATEDDQRKQLSALTRRISRYVREGRLIAGAGGILDT